uniref:Uncharacterized protein n=1 Tax=Escherichia coli TaxID=562 RepID=A0A5S9CY85_ECOLX|nr:hypothetical protein [Escherichia coli]
MSDYCPVFSGPDGQHPTHAKSLVIYNGDGINLRKPVIGGVGQQHAI